MLLGLPPADSLACVWRHIPLVGNLLAAILVLLVFGNSIHHRLVEQFGIDLFDEWPHIFDTILMSVPPFKSSVALVCLAQWLDKGLSMPAACATTFRYSLYFTLVMMGNLLLYF